MTTKYTQEDFRIIVKDLITSYNKTNPAIKAKISNGYYIEITDNHASLVLNHCERISMVL